MFVVYLIQYVKALKPCHTFYFLSLPVFLKLCNGVIQTSLWWLYACRKPWKLDPPFLIWLKAVTQWFRMQFSAEKNFLATAPKLDKQNSESFRSAHTKFQANLSIFVCFRAIFWHSADFDPFHNGGRNELLIFLVYFE